MVIINNGSGLFVQKTYLVTMMIAKGIDIFSLKWQVWALGNCSLVRELKGHLGQVSVSHFHIALSRS